MIKSLAKASMNTIVVGMGGSQGRAAGVAEQAKVPILQVRSIEDCTFLPAYPTIMILTRIHCAFLLFLSRLLLMSSIYLIEYLQGGEVAERTTDDGNGANAR